MGVLGGMGESRFWILCPLRPRSGLVFLEEPLIIPSRLDSPPMAPRTSLALGRSAGLTARSLVSSWYSFDGRSGRAFLSSWNPFQCEISIRSRSISSSSSLTELALTYGRRPKHMKYRIIPSEKMSDLVVKLPYLPVASCFRTSGAQYEMVPVDPVDLRTAFSGWTSPKSLIKHFNWWPSRWRRQLLGLRSRWM
jgi:hypothetical protein